jgi:hypothetical protein
MPDLLTKERTQDEINELAQSWRGLFGVAAEEKPDIRWCVEAQLPTLFPHFALVVRDDGELSSGPAVAEYSPPRIEIRESAYLGLITSHPVSRFALTHELGHLVLHPHELPKFLKDGVQERHRLARMSIENQADEFALFFLVPEHIAIRIRSLVGTVQRCAVPYGLARSACDIYGIRYRKLMPYELADLLTSEEEPFS